jgi:hypothetical protein
MCWTKRFEKKIF